MGLAGISPVQLLVILLIVLLIFGSKRIRNLGGDLGGMLRGIRDGFKDLEETKQAVDEATKDIEEKLR